MRLKHLISAIGSIVLCVSVCHAATGSASGPLASGPERASGNVYSTDRYVGPMIFVKLELTDYPGLRVGSPNTEPCRDEFGYERMWEFPVWRRIAVMQTEFTQDMWASLEAAYSDWPVADPSVSLVDFWNYHFSPDIQSWPNEPSNSITLSDVMLLANYLSMKRGLNPVYYDDSIPGHPCPISQGNASSATVIRADNSADGYRLPSEFEWEFFTRAGTTGPFFIDVPEYTESTCWWSCQSYEERLQHYVQYICTHGQPATLSNPWNLKNTLGSVRELCFSWYEDYPWGWPHFNYDDSTVFYTEYDTKLVVRGGDFQSGISEVRCARREGQGDTQSSPRTGFRLVRTVDEWGGWPNQSWLGPHLSAHGGGSYQIGDQMWVGWDSCGLFDEPVTISLYQGNNFVCPLGVKPNRIESLEQPYRGFMWEIPDNGSIQTATEYRIRVQQGERDSFSSEFTIAGSPFVIPSPDGTRAFRQGSTQEIRWTAKDVTGDVTVMLYQGDTPIRTIAENISAQSGLLTWDVPVDLPDRTDYRICLVQDPLQGFSRKFPIGFIKLRPLSARLTPDLDDNGWDRLPWGSIHYRYFSLNRGNDEPVSGDAIPALELEAVAKEESLPIRMDMFRDGILQVGFNGTQAEAAQSFQFEFPSRIYLDLVRYDLDTGPTEPVRLVTAYKSTGESIQLFSEGSAGLTGILGAGAGVGPATASFSAASAGVKGQAGARYQVDISRSDLSSGDQFSQYQGISYQLDAGLGPEFTFGGAEALVVSATGLTLGSTLKAFRSGSLDFDGHFYQFNFQARRIAVLGTLCRALSMGNPASSGPFAWVIERAADRWLKSTIGVSPRYRPEEFFTETRLGLGLESSGAVGSLSLLDFSAISAANLSCALQAFVVHKPVLLGKAGVGLNFGTEATAPIDLVDIKTKHLPLGFPWEAGKACGLEYLVNSDSQGKKSLSISTEATEYAETAYILFTGRNYTGFQTTWSIEDPALVSALTGDESLTFAKLNRWLAGPTVVNITQAFLQADMAHTLDKLENLLSSNEGAAVRQDVNVRQAQRFNVDWGVSAEVAIVGGLELGVSIKAAMEHQVVRPWMTSIYHKGIYFPLNEYSAEPAGPDISLFLAELSATFTDVVPLFRDLPQLIRMDRKLIVDKSTGIDLFSVTGESIGRIEVTAEYLGREVVSAVIDRALDCVSGAQAFALDRGYAMFAQPTVYLDKNVQIRTVVNPESFFRETGIITNKQRVAIVEFPDTEAVSCLRLAGPTVKLAAPSDSQDWNTPLPGPLQITLTVRDLDLAVAGLGIGDIAGMRVYRYDEETGVWALVPGSVAAGRDVQAVITQPGMYAIGLESVVDLETDPDLDGLTMAQEDLNGNGLLDAGETDPWNWDSDGDGFSDGQETAAGSDPLDGGSSPLYRRLDIARTDGGDTYPPAGQYLYPDGATVSVKAQPDIGYSFDSWSGDVLGNANPVSILLDGNTQLTAHFSALPAVPGDANLDWVLDTQDLVLLAQFLAENYVPNPDDYWAPLAQLDMNSDGRLNLTDLAILTYQLAASGPEDLTPVAPAGLQAVLAAAGGVDLSWTDHSSDETGFSVIRRRGDQNDWQVVAILPADTESYMDVSAQGGRTCYRVRAYNAYGYSQSTNEVSISVPYRAGDLAGTDPIVGEMRFIPGGSFQQGSPAGEPCRNDDETPYDHTLTVDLAVMATEVTRQMWADLKALQPGLPADPTISSTSSGMNHPVQDVLWFEAILFANLLSGQEGLAPCYYKDAAFTMLLSSANYQNGSPIYCQFSADGYRLPTEGEWEYLCRSGQPGPFCVDEPAFTAGQCDSYITTPGTWPMLESVAWFSANRYDPAGNDTSKPAGTKTANLWSLYDLHGNAWEWCWDWYASYPDGAATDYRGPDSGDSRVMRGGSWNSLPLWCRSAFRWRGGPWGRAGFRLVRKMPVP